jgi:hypothetical protein
MFLIICYFHDDRKSEEIVSETKIEPRKSSNTNKSAVLSHYPKIAYDYDKTIQGETHQELFRNLVSDVCDVELAGLLNHFSSDQLKGVKAKQSILDSLTAVIADLPKEACASVSVGTNFLPELSADQSIELQNLVEEKKRLEQYSSILEKYQNEIEEFAAANELWIGAIPTDAHIGEKVVSIAYFFHVAKYFH